MAITTLNNRSINRSDTASADQVWTATSATASDFQAAGGGKILQVVQSTNAYQKSSASTSSQDIESSSGVTWEPAITLSATSSKILVLASIMWYTEGTSTAIDHRWWLRMNSKTGAGSYGAVVTNPYGGLYYYSAVRNDAANFSQIMNQLITPSSTDEIKIKFEYKSLSASGYNLVINYGSTSSCTLLEVAG